VKVLTAGAIPSRFLALTIIFAFVAPGLSQAKAATGELVTSTAIEIVCINTTDNGIVFDFLELIDLSSMKGAAAEHSEAIPHLELKSYLPDSPSGWGPPLKTSSGNHSFSCADGIYMNGDWVVWVAIMDGISDWSYRMERSLVWKNWNVSMDQGYPKWHTIDGYQAFEARSSGDNAPEGADSFGGIFVALHESMPVMEPVGSSWFCTLLGLFLVRRLQSSHCHTDT